MKFTAEQKQFILEQAVHTASSALYQREHNKSSVLDDAPDSLKDVAVDSALAIVSAAAKAIGLILELECLDDA
jgi:hypothetical protein